MRYSPLLLVLLLALTACKPTVPGEYIQPDDMADILYEYHVAQAMARCEYSDSTELVRERLTQAVFRRHGISQADFDSSLVYYYGHVNKLKEIYVRVNERMADEARALGASVGDMHRYSQFSESGDTANIWNETTNVLLMPRPTVNRFDFTVSADTTFMLGDSFLFQFVTEYVYQNGSRDAVVNIAAVYEGDSVRQTNAHISVPGISQVRIPANRDRQLRQLRGFIYLAAEEERTDQRKLMFISQMQLIRFHDKSLKLSDENKKDTVKADSLQRGADPRPSAADSADSHPVGRGLRSQSAPFRRRAGSN